MTACTCQDCRHHPARDAYWWPATSGETGLPEMWLVATDDDERLAIAPAGMYPAGARVQVGVTR